MTQSTAFKNILIIGGSSAMAAACARVWLAQGAQQLLLWGRDSLKLERTANDLRIRAPAAHITSACV
ncbi:MAG: hypothetical protein KKD00_08095, partial [Gammaproteobacteria bacterium]|nr:hypothetical protein [Gammaproteobacteria bacterium]